jgi:hypothetical protein
MILAVISAYYPKIKIPSGFMIAEMIIAVGISITWYFLKEKFSAVPIINSLEPMIIGLLFALILHVIGLCYNPRIRS